MKTIVVGVMLLCLAVACGASFTGPATSSAGDPCSGHLQCPQGCCTMGGNGDGDGWYCNPPGFGSGICDWSPGSIGPGDPYGAKRRRDAGADAARKP